MAPVISIVISTYHSKTLEFVLDALEKQTYKDFEVIVSDDGSQDWKYISDRPYRLKYVWHQDKGRTWSAAQNEGIRLAQGKYLLLLHDDVIPREDLLEQFVKNMDEYSICSGNKVTIQDSKRALKNPKKFIISEDHKVRLNQNNFVARGIDTNTHRVIEATEHFSNEYLMISGCLLMMPLDKVREIGMCAEDYPGWGLEDNDLVMRLVRSGCRVKMCLDAVAYSPDQPPLVSKEVDLNIIEFAKREQKTSYIKNFNYKL